MHVNIANLSVDHVTLKDGSDKYLDGCLPIVDPRVVLLGCEGSGKTSLVHTLVGNSFQSAPLTKAADQMEVNVTTAADWKIINEKEKIADLKKQALLKSEGNFTVDRSASQQNLPIKPTCSVSTDIIEEPKSLSQFLQTLKNSISFSTAQRKNF